ncbi:hypothetical protein C7414_109169 [Cupriavidus alkaliphilus]|uniref:DUF6587 family protein n=1 Tax=Cupriavidus alkaliphilus TaxID=942866 RepID=UPI0008162F85|nr:DUF6587 family protein [Cupriavidus alkaliphilus]PVY76686.1 hypothetical protein C7414_109169 [Cupriavidus alkaliphilus]SCB27826.1 hypothetical protein GA0116996_10984 [Cupriavidus alkaliphilus]
MSLYHAIETLLVPLIVLACAVSVVARYAPRTRERVKAALAARLGGPAATGWRGRLARWLAPQSAAGCASGCDDGGCNTCGANTSTNTSTPTGQDKPAEQVVRFVRKR